MLEDKKLIEITEENKVFFADRRVLTSYRPKIHGNFPINLKNRSNERDTHLEKSLNNKDSGDFHLEKRIDYLSLTKADRERLFEHSVRKISTLCKESGFRQIFRKIENFVKGNIRNKEAYDVSLQAYEIIDYIKEHGSDHKGIFRIPGHASTYRRLVESIRQNNTVDCRRHSIDDLASALKAYVREDLGGVIPDTVCVNLLKIYKKGSSEDIYRAKTYFPFALLDSRRELFLKLVEMLYALDKKASHNFMPISNLVCVMPFVFFPEKLCIGYETAITISRILIDLFNLDYQRFPKSLYNELELRNSRLDL